MNKVAAGNSAILPAKPSPFLHKGFVWYTRRLLKKKFHSVLITPDGIETFESLADHDGPLLTVSNHPSWWDPVLLLQTGNRFFEGRPTTGPIEASQWLRYSTMKRLGIFGLDSDHPNALEQFVEHVKLLCAEESRTVVGITPQGAFADPRTPVRLRPGAAAVAASAPNIEAIAIALEYAFWDEPKPVACVHARRVLPPENQSLTAWHRVLTRSLQATVDELAPRVIARSFDNFQPLIQP